MVRGGNCRSSGRFGDRAKLAHTAIQAFDQDAWVTTGHYDKRDPRQSIELFRVLREANLSLLKSLTPEQWKCHGVHSERGNETIEHIARMFAGHDLNHTQQIERILRKPQASLSLPRPSRPGGRRQRDNRQAAKK
jgi:hypothetical protein